MSIMALRNGSVSEIIKTKFYIACEEDDSKVVKEFLKEKVIDPCEMGYKLLRYAIDNKCEKIVETMVDSEFFSNLPDDTRFSLKIASKTGDSEFAMYMLG